MDPTHGPKIYLARNLLALPEVIDAYHRCTAVVE
jgi:hypothetical protein